MTKKTSMKRFHLLVLILLWGLEGCQTVNLQPPTENPAVSSPTAVATVVKSNVTLTVLPTATPSPTVTPVPSPTALPISLLAEKGFLLIWDDVAKQYKVIDLNGGVLSTVQWNKECGSELLPGTTTVVCKHASGQHYLNDILRGTKRDLLIWNAPWISWSPNGQFLIYSHNIDAGEPILSYQISANSTVTLTARLNLDWLELPVLSADGQTLIAARNYTARRSRIFEIVRGTSQYRPIGLDQPFSTGDIAWSPVSSRFVYGATDIDQEVVPAPNYLFLADTKTRKVREIAKAPHFFLGPIVWSPTGKQIAVTRVNEKSEVCIINVDNAEQVCPDIGIPTWSPTGEHIAFVNTVRELLISRPDGTEAIKLLENVPGDFLLFWR